MKLFSMGALLAVIVLTLGAPLRSAPAVELTFTTTQFSPINEQEYVRNTLLRPFTDETGIRVELISDLDAPYVDRLVAEAKAGRGTVGVTGALHGTFPVLVAEGAVQDAAALMRQLEGRPDRTFAPDLMRAGQIGGIQAFVPWMQATYVIAAHKQAMRYFPEGRNPNAMTYDDLLQWGQNIRSATGQRRLGFPALAGTGLYHRFIHGFAYPSFTGSQVKRFKAPEAVEMWQYLRRLWGVSHPSSFRYDAMNQPLLQGEVWVAWDHVARLLPAFRERPDDFVALPSPAGPKGRSFLVVIVGLAIPKSSPNADAAARFIEYMTRPRTQVLTLQGVGFFPVVREAAGVVPTGGLKVIAEGVATQASARDARTALLPVGLGARTGEFAPLYLETFTLIAVQGRNIQQVLSDQARKLEELYRAMNAPCPLPDPPERPCRPD